jgi:hypothetical protein
MRLVTFAEAASYDLKEKVPATRGKITRINDYKSGVTNGNNWSFQNFELCDPDQPTIRLRVKVWNRDEVPKTWINKIVLIESVEGERGPKGVVMEQDTYKWKEGQPIKKQLEIQCSDGALFELAQNAGTQQRPDPRNQPAQSRQQAASEPPPQDRAERAESRPAPQRGNQRPESPEDYQPANPPHRESNPAPAQKTTEQKIAEREAEYRKAIIDAGKFAGRKLAGMAVVMRAVDKLADERQKIGKPLSVDQFQGICTTIFIAGDRNFQWDKLPTTLADLEKFWPEPRKADNQQPAQ